MTKKTDTKLTAKEIAANKKAAAKKATARKRTAKRAAKKRADKALDRIQPYLQGLGQEKKASIVAELRKIIESL